MKRRTRPGKFADDRRTGGSGRREPEEQLGEDE